MRRIEELKNSVLNSNDINILFKNKIELSEIAASVHKELYSASTEIDKINKKGSLKTVYSILTTCQDKIDRIKLEKIKTNSCMFIDIAKKELEPEVFNNILKKCINE